MLQLLVPGEHAGNVTGHNADTTELYGAVSAGPATLKYSHAITNLFGFPNSKGSDYLDLTATFDLGNGLSLIAAHRPPAHPEHRHLVHRLTRSTLAKDFGKAPS